jgi:hypothetical protein
MRGSYSLLLGLVAAVSFSSFAYGSCQANEQPSELSSLARSIQTLNGQFDTPARRIAPAARLTAGERTLLLGRLQLVEQLIRAHPEEARSVMLDPSRMAAMVAADPTAAALLEQDTELNGEMVQAVADDFAHHSSTSHFYLHTATGEIELFPTHTLELGRFLHQRVKANGVGTRAVMAVESVGPPSPAAAPDATAFSSTVAADATVACSTTGVQKTAVLLLKFPDTSLTYPAGLDSPGYWQQAVAGSANPSTSNYWSEASYGQTSSTADVYGPFTLPQTYDCTNTGGMYTAAITAAASTVDFSTYTRVVLVYPAATCSFGGLGSIGCYGASTTINHPSSVAWIPVTPGDSPTGDSFWGDLNHEMGHNLGMNHANSLDFGALSLGPLDFQATNPGVIGGTGATTATGAVTAVNTEYGDNFSAMGADNWSGFSGPYSAEHRAKLLGWLPPASVQTVFYSGTYMLTPLSSTTGLRALRVLRDPASSSWLWVEFREPAGYYESAMLSGVSGNDMASGAMVHYENGFGDPLYTYQVDMAPTATPNKFVGGALTPGKTWSDPYSLLDITTNYAAGAGLSVSATYETPCAAVGLSNGVIPAAGGSGTVTITAPSTCSWAVSTNPAWMTLGGTASGTGNGVVTYTAAANTAKDQRSTYITAQRQSLPVVQEGTTVNVLGVNPAGGTVASNASTLYTMSFADAAGISDVNSVHFTVQGAGPSCVVYAAISNNAAYFYLYNNGVYTNSLLGGTTGTLSIPGCTLSGQRSGLAVSGNNMTLTMDVSLTPSAPGAFAMIGSVGGKAYSSAVIPLGTLIVGETLPALIVSPSSGRSASAVGVTIEGNGTHFSPQSTVQIDGTGVSVGTPSFVNGTTLNATLTVSSSAVPTMHTITVTTGSEVVTAPFTATGIPTTLSVTSTAQVFAGKAVTLTAITTATGAIPTGTVTFFDGDPSKSLGTGTLSNGSTTLSLSTLATGSHAIGASYSSVDGFSPSQTASTVAVAVSDFALTGLANGITEVAGATTGNTATVTIAPGTGGFTTAIFFTCSGAPSAASCVVSPSTATPGSSSATVTVTVSTTARPTDRTASRRNHPAGLLAVLLAVPFFGLTSRVLRRNAKAGLLAWMVMLAGVSLMAGGCSSGSNSTGSQTPPAPPGTPAGASSLTITGTATIGTVTLTHTVAIALTVN